MATKIIPDISELLFDALCRALEAKAILHCRLEALNHSAVRAAYSLTVSGCETFDAELGEPKKLRCSAASDDFGLALTLLHRVMGEEKDDMATWGAIRLLEQAQEQLKSVTETIFEEFEHA